MWWNFVARTSDGDRAAREDWAGRSALRRGEGLPRSATRRAALRRPPGPPGRSHLTGTRARPQDPPVSETPPPESPPPPRATVLVASSDSATRDLLRRVLDVPAVEVVDASDGVEALALARRLDLDLVILLDAFLAVHGRRLRVRPHPGPRPTSTSPPILMLGLSSERTIEVALTSGADETLAKPLNPALLRYRVGSSCVRRQEERRLRLCSARSRRRRLRGGSPRRALVRVRGRAREPGIPAADRLRGRRAPRQEPAPARGARDRRGGAHRAAPGHGRGPPHAGAASKSYRKDGQAFWNDLAASPVVDAAGRLTHYVSVQSDVTALLEAPSGRPRARWTRRWRRAPARWRPLSRRVEERRRFTETILNSLVSAILATDAKGTVTFANLAALRTLGTSLHDCVGRSVVELFGHHEGVAEVIAGTVAAHPEHRLDFPLISPGGTRFYVGMSITPAPAAFRDEVAFIFLFRDLAETIDIETDPKLKQLATAQDEADLRAEPPAAEPEAKQRRPARAALHRAGRPRPCGHPGPGRAAHRRRPVRAPRDGRRPAGGPARPAAGDGGAHHPARERPRGLPRPLRGAGAPHAGGDDGRPRRQAVARRRASRSTYPAVITDRDLGTDPGGTARRPQRRMDFATAEKLLEANGGSPHPAAAGRRGRARAGRPARARQAEGLRPAGDR